MKSWKKWLGAASIAATTAVTYGIAHHVSNRLLYYKKKDLSLVIDREIAAKRLDQDGFSQLPLVEKEIPSPFGYSIHSWFITPFPDTKKVMIFSHGVSENKWNSIKYMNIFRELGFNAVLYDHRRHGNSGGDTTSYGVYEKRDLAAVVAETKRVFGDDALIGIHGESMGAVTTLLYASQVEDAVDFYVADCPFASFADQVAERMKTESKVPLQVLMPVIDAVLFRRAGYSMYDSAPIDTVDRIKKPVLFITTEKDDYIPASATIALYHKKQGAKKLSVLKNGLHAQGLNENKEEYQEVVKSFLDEMVYDTK